MRDGLASKGDRLAGVDGPQPLQVLEAGGGAEYRPVNRPETVPSLFFLLQEIVLHPVCAGVPARGAQRAEYGAARRFLVSMERLRVKFLGESLDLLGGEGVRAESY